MAGGVFLMSFPDTDALSAFQVSSVGQHESPGVCCVVSINRPRYHFFQRRTHLQEPSVLA